MMEPSISSVHPSPQSLTILEEVHSSPASTIFKVFYEGGIYAMKLYHNNGDPGYTDDGSDMNRFRCELGAYRNLFSYGVCERGFVLQCYGYCDNFKRSEFPSDIVSHFENDTEDPQALFLEYLVDPEVLNCVNYTAERMQKAIAALQEVHNAHVLHEDLYPKNILIVPGDPERVLVTDFDVSETFGDTRPWHPIFGDVVENEMEVFIDLGRLLAEDQQEGLPPNTKFY